MSAFPIWVLMETVHLYGSGLHSHIVCDYFTNEKSNNQNAMLLNWFGSLFDPSREFITRLFARNKDFYILKTFEGMTSKSSMMQAEVNSTANRNEQSELDNRSACLVYASLKPVLSQLMLKTLENALQNNIIST